MDSVFAMMSVTTPVVVGGAAGVAAFLGLYPPTPRDLGGARDLDDQAERVKIPVLEGDHVEGWFLPGSAPVALLLLHGYGRTHHRMWRYAGFLGTSGYSLLAIDFRSSRRSRRLPTTLGVHERHDARAAYHWLRQRTGAAQLAVMGESLGGTVALLLAGEERDVAAVVVDCPFANGRLAVEDMLGRFLRLPRWPSAPMARALGIWATGRDLYEVDAERAARRLHGRPILFIHSAKDERLTPHNTQRLWEAAGAKDPVWWVPGVGHNQAWRAHPDEYERRVMEFLRKTVG